MARSRQRTSIAETSAWNLRAKGDDNLRYFAGGLYWGKSLAQMQSTFSDLPQAGKEWLVGDYYRHMESLAEMRAKPLAGSMSYEIEEELGKHAPWNKEDEASNEAWAHVRRSAKERLSFRPCVWHVCVTLVRDSSRFLRHPLYAGGDLLESRNESISLFLSGNGGCGAALDVRRPSMSLPIS